MKRSLRSQVLVVLVVATVAPAVLVGALAIRRARADIEIEVVRGHLAHVRALGSSLEKTLQSARRALELTSAWWADDRTADALGPGDAERLIRRLRRQVPLIAEVSVLDTAGQLLAGPPVEIDVRGGAHTFGGYVGDVVFTAAGPKVPIVCQARSRTGELVGVFVARLELGFVEDALAEARLGDRARLLVVDGTGTLIASTSGEAGGANLRDRAAVDRALGSATEGSVLGGGVLAVYRNLSSFQSLRGLRWAIVLEQPEAAAFALARDTTRDTLVVGGAVLLAALGLGALLASRLTRPLRDLAARADAIAGASGGPEPPPLPVDAPGEIGVLAQRLGDMARRLGERDELQAAVAHGDRLGTIGTLTASVAHEINNPLTTILGYSNLLLEDKSDGHADRAGLELIADEAARMKTIVGTLLDYSRSETAHGPAEIEPLLRRTSLLLGPELGRRRLRVDIDCEAELPRAAGADQAIQQILVNLVENAAHASPDGGAIDLRAARDGDRLRLEVVDDGPGIDPALRERVFEPFYTTKGAGSGTGLGLAVCAHLASEMGGRLEVGDGPAGRGARFTLVLPMAPWGE